MAEAVAYAGTELEALAEADNYYRWILRQLSPYLGPHTAEVGAGLGTFALRLLEAPATRRLTLFEPDPGLSAALTERFAERDEVEVRRTVFDPAGVDMPLDTIVLVNVLEHIGDDAGFARDAWDSLRPGGVLAIFVPALPFLYGSLDRAFDHRRRYTRASMKDLLADAGFEVRHLRYMNLPGVVSWFVAGRVVGMKTIRPSSMRWYDRLVVPWVSRLESVVAPPVGQNLLAIGVKPDVHAAVVGDATGDGSDEERR
jgi:SAM-dependent methyltransferase